VNSTQSTDERSPQPAEAEAKHAHDEREALARCIAAFAPERRCPHERPGRSG
jgi:hypothetical protein